MLTLRKKAIVEKNKKRRENFVNGFEQLLNERGQHDFGCPFSVDIIEKTQINITLQLKEFKLMFMLCIHSTTASMILELTHSEVRQGNEYYWGMNNFGRDWFNVLCYKRTQGEEKIFHRKTLHEKFYNRIVQAWQNWKHNEEISFTHLLNI